MNASERVMPIVNVRYEEALHRWLVALPGGITMPAQSTDDAKEIVRKYAPGSAVKFWRAAPLTETEQRALHGDR